MRDSDLKRKLANLTEEEMNDLASFLKLDHTTKAGIQGAFENSKPED